MNSVADIIVYAPDGPIALVAEVKRGKGVDDEWAAKLRRNLLVHGLIPTAQFFLLALSDCFYIWRSDDSQSSVRANYKVPTETVLDRYLETGNTAVHVGTIAEDGLELITTSWLNDVVASNLDSNDFPESDWLFESGLYSSIQGGSVRTEVSG